MGYGPYRAIASRRKGLGNTRLPDEVTRDEIRAWLAERFPDEAFLLADGFEDAFAGVVTGKGREPVVCYDRGRCIEVLMTRDGMSWEDAEEFFAFNVEDAWVGERTPVFLVEAAERE